MYVIIKTASSVGESEEITTNGTSSSETGADDLDTMVASDLSRANSESHLHLMSLELANRGPRQSESELRSAHSLSA